MTSGQLPRPARAISRQCTAPNGGCRRGSTRTAVDGVHRRARLPNRAKPDRARVALRKLAASVAAVALLNTGASPTAGAVPAPATTRFVDNGGPILHRAQVYLLYWGRAWAAATGTSSPTPDQISAEFGWVVNGPYLSGLAEYRGIRPPVLRGSTVVTTSGPHRSFDDDDVSDFLDAQLDAGVVPGPDLNNQTLYIVVIPVGASARDGSHFDGEHNYYTRHGRRIHYAWAADSGSLARATRIMSHELVESVTDPEGSAVGGVSRACAQSGWCEIADVCSDTSVVDGVAVSPYWSEKARACIAPTLAGTTVPLPARAPRAAPASKACPSSVGSTLLRITSRRPRPWCE